MKKHFSLFLLFSLFVFLLSASCDDSQGIDPPPAVEPEPPPIEGTAEPVTRAIKIDMYDSGENGWGGNGALIIKINGIEIANNVKVHTTAADNTPSGQKKANTYTFTATTGDVVELYWAVGTSQRENSFIVYYTDTSPIPAFNNDSNNEWDGENALFFQLRSTMNNMGNGKLGAFTVSS